MFYKGIQTVSKDRFNGISEKEKLKFKHNYAAEGESKCLFFEVSNGGTDFLITFHQKHKMISRVDEFNMEKMTMENTSYKEQKRFSILDDFMDLKEFLLKNFARKHILVIEQQDAHFVISVVKED